MGNADTTINIKEKKVGETQISAKQLAKQQASDSRDIVRYETGVTVVEAGRFGSSGYAIRGVEENRVAVQIDGLAQAETISSQGFKELFEGYGNFNNTRNSAEIETLKEVKINKGANSIKAGSGALGGSVSFETKDARDFLTEKDYHFSYKRGYNSVNQQNLNTLTTAGRYKWFDFLVVHTDRQSNETQNYGYHHYDGNIQGKTREKADPYRYKLKSTLLKVSFQPTENHRLTLVADLYDNTSKGHDFSYNLNASKYIKNCSETEGHCAEKALRHTNDQVKRNNYSVIYENYSVNPLYDTLRISFSNQKIRTRARTDDYCDGNSRCEGFNNPLGLHFNEENQIVGKDNQPIKYEYIPAKTTTKETIYEKKTFTGITESSKYWYYPSYKNEITKKQDQLKQQYGTLDVSFDTDKPNEKGEAIVTYTINKKETTPASYNLTVNKHLYKEKEPVHLPATITSNLGDLIFACDQNGGINCDKSTVKALNSKNGNTEDIPITIDKAATGDRIARLTPKPTSKDYNLVLPSGAGYLENTWTKRDLNTITKQLNLDLTKYIEIGRTQHNLSYGGLWSQIKKEMINHSGFNAISKVWWATYPKDCQSGDGFNPFCNRIDTYSFLIPVKTNTTALYFADDVKVNNYWGFDWAFRYDRVKHSPEYVPGKTPKVPDGLVANPELEPKYDITKLSDPKELEKMQQNALARIQEIAQKRKHAAHSYSLGLTLDPFDWLRVQTKYSKGFRAPTSDETYFTFEHPLFTIRPNSNLMFETSKNRELVLTFHKSFGYLSTSVFHTDYNNYIDLAAVGRGKPIDSKGKPIGAPIYKNINRKIAKVNGLELQAKLILGEIAKPLTGFSIGYKFTYQKGKMTYDPRVDEGKPTDGYIPMNAIQPKTSVINLSYAHPKDYFGIDVYLTHVSAKKEKATHNRYHKYDDSKNSYVKWRSNAYTLIDLISFVKPIPNLTLQAGVYNLTNKKYITWDSARSIRPFGTSNMINQKTGEGINRFYAPGRNYRMSVQFEF
ncbi:TonB-dependent hemoglobin/transferrin/lactoferrin family receptor [Haemophilus influenzae]|uniref:TonB-dependent hemoglobin/transferrin/lactoferrin family receptor n=1 Tax=Haemophilus influenzae TaxID=727 RepID=UPI001EF951EE|nr:TonB-dependent hemoglobin/transferrin/lactoferrin family receptor [Haemophilus influenzae]